MFCPNLYDYSSFNKIPADKGIYAFFFSFDYLNRLLATFTTPTDINVTQTLEKCLRAHTLSTPNKVDINLYGKAVAYTSMLEILSSHRIKLGKGDEVAPTTDFKYVADVLTKCALLTTPIYIGITVNQTFNQRFEQHRSKYERLKSKIATSSLPAKAVTKSSDPYDSSGKFHERLVRRNIEFRDLIFACIPLNSSEISHAKSIEKILQALINPSLSTSH
jgi:hypothetical protein